MIEVDRDACVLCGLCTGVCPPNALELLPAELRVLPHCSDCGYCLPYCPVGALHATRPPKRRPRNR